MKVERLVLITTAAMIGFAGNSLLCRLALTTSQIDAASFTSIRLISGAVTLVGLVWLKNRSPAVGGNWLSAVALFTYAAGFSFAYISMPAGTGALLLFGAVQATMIGYGLLTGERLNSMQMIGIALAIAGLIGLLLPGVEAPPLAGTLLMLGAGVAWGIYSIRGRGAGDPTKDTSGNFLRSVPLAAVVSVVMFTHSRMDYTGAAYAVASGALASGLGYAVWYTALPFLRATTAATVQLSVPAIAALGGMVFLGEPITLRLGMASGAILGGIGVSVLSKGGKR
jgi:drug/metabolite transporter (DMT)-like permease